MMTSHDVIKHMVRTEKGTKMLIDNKYVFKVDTRANKIQIRQAVQELYKVAVHDVNIINMKGKKKRVRQREGMTSAWKKAIVTLKADNRIEVT